MKIKKIVKMQLKEYLLHKRLLFIMFIITAVTIILAKRIIDSSIYLSMEINNWDIAFRISTYPFFIILVYTPIIVVSTSIFNNSNKYMYNVYIRVSKKINWVIGNIIATIVLNLFIVTAWFTLIFIISIIYSKYDNTWSVAIVNAESNLKVMTELYPNGFVFEMQPIKAFIISYIEILLGTVLVTCIRDMVHSISKSRKNTNIITIIYIFLNYILMTYPTMTNIRGFLESISLHNIMILWYHKFEKNSFANITVYKSILLSFIYIIIFIIIRIILSKRVEKENDL